MMPRVVKVAPLPNTGCTSSSTTVSGTIDLSCELDGEVFHPLHDEALFRQLTVDEFGSVCWPGGPD